MVEQGGAATRQLANRVLLGLIWVLLQIRQLETAAKQQVQELGLKQRKRNTKKNVGRFLKNLNSKVMKLS